MSTATRRATSRKAMRVATVFTGAAAAAVAYAPAALAAPGHAPAQGHTALANGKTGGARTAIESKGCGASDVHWLHVQYNSPFRVLCKAFGFAGVKDVGQLTMYAQCGGNNYGNLFTQEGVVSFGPGNTYRSFTYGKYLSAVSIYYWNGTDQCRWPR
jgi:hypothetical protein